MLEQKQLVESTMTERLLEMRQVYQPFRPCEKVDAPNVVSRNGPKFSTMTNENRNKRRAELNRAIIGDLCDIVTDLFISESRLLTPSKYGFDDSVRRDHVYTCIKKFVESLPPRYALGAETPSEVLLHMRLMASVRTDPSRATVHIRSLANDKHWTCNSAKAGRNLRLVTISCADATGLLEYISQLLSSDGSKVLDAEVMLSTDNIVLVSSRSGDLWQLVCYLHGLCLMCYCTPLRIVS